MEYIRARGAECEEAERVDASASDGQGGQGRCAGRRVRLFAAAVGGVEAGGGTEGAGLAPGDADGGTWAAAVGGGGDGWGHGDRGRGDTVTDVRAI